METNILIRKKSGVLQDYDYNKILVAIRKSAIRAGVTLTEEQERDVVSYVENIIFNRSDNVVSVEQMHEHVIAALSHFVPEVGVAYREYHDWAKKEAERIAANESECQSIQFGLKKDNANMDTALVSTKRAKKMEVHEKSAYIKYNLTRDQRQAVEDGYIYVHDMAFRRDAMNCSLFNAQNVLTGGFEMGNIWYNEPKTLDVAFDVIGDIVLSAASQQYGGFTLYQVDEMLAPYAEKSYQSYLKKYLQLTDHTKKAEKMAYDDTITEMKQGFQGWEYKFNTVGSSRGDYPFITTTLGHGTQKWAPELAIASLETRMGGQGKKGFKKPVLFPKIVFLYDKALHGPGKELEKVFEVGVRCSAKTMYPDWLSLSGRGYIASMYQKYGEIISPMGCRAFLSPWYERGGMHPADENDKPVFKGRFNIGAISLNLPMILAKAKRDCKDFYEVLDYYLQMIREIHLQTYAYLGRMKASFNPLAFCEGGFYKGNLNPDDNIAPCLEPATASFGITAFNELQRLYNGKSLAEEAQAYIERTGLVDSTEVKESYLKECFYDDLGYTYDKDQFGFVSNVKSGFFALDVLQYINQKIEQFKEEDGRLYAIYGTPAESLCFSGDTLVQTYLGDKRIDEIVSGDLVYSYNEELNRIELKKVVASQKTQKNAKIIEVLFDNGQTIKCTPNHPFAVRKCKKDSSSGKFNGRETFEWIPASELKLGDRIKSNYIKKDDEGRYYCSLYSQNGQQLLQDINAEFIYGPKPNGYVTHHKDENKSNNLFENLEYLTGREHRIHHLSSTIEKHKYTHESQLGSNNNFYGKHHSALSRLKNRLAHIGKSVEIFDENMNHLDHFDCLDDVENKGYTRNLAKKACDGTYHNHLYKGFLWFYTNDCSLSLLEQNHKVVSIKYLDSLEDVYNIEVEDNHNYFVGGMNGLLVHNCGLQIRQFRKEFGIIEGVSDREYVSNSFHCHVSEDITPIEKQDYEGLFWEMANGGKIQYVRYPVNYNFGAIKSLIRRAMEKGFYEGVNLSLAYCDDCGHEELEMDVCPVCGSKNLTKIDRMNGYLAYSRVHGDTRLNAAKMAEIADRKSM